MGVQGSGSNQTFHGLDNVLVGPSNAMVNLTQVKDYEFQCNSCIGIYDNCVVRVISVEPQAAGGSGDVRLASGSVVTGSPPPGGEVLL